MSLYHTEGRGDAAQSYSKSVITTAPFNTQFFTYTTSKNQQFQTVGTLTVVSGATSTNCPAGRVLHLTGKRLVPGINPGVTSVLYSVYDPITFLSGLVDLTSSTFGRYDQNLPNSFNDGRSGSGVLPPLGGLGGKLTVSDAGLQSVAVSGTVASGTASCGNVTLTSRAAGSFTVSTLACTANSQVFLTKTSAAFGVTDFWAQKAPSAGSFTVTTLGANTDDVSFNWLVLN